MLVVQHCKSYAEVTKQFQHVTEQPTKQFQHVEKSRQSSETCRKCTKVMRKLRISPKTFKTPLFWKIQKNRKWQRAISRYSKMCKTSVVKVDSTRIFWARVMFSRLRTKGSRANAKVKPTVAQPRTMQEMIRWTCREASMTRLNDLASRKTLATTLGKPAKLFKDVEYPLLQIRYPRIPQQGCSVLQRL